MKNLLQNLFSVFCISLFIGLSPSLNAQICNYTLDFKDKNTFEVDCLLPTGSSHVSSSQWKVEGDNQGAAHCYLEPQLDFSTCSNSDLLVAFFVNRTGALMAGDYVSVEIQSDKVPHWAEILLLDATYLNSMNDNSSYHDCVISAGQYSDINSLDIRLVIYSTGNGSPIFFKDGELWITTSFAPLPLELTDINAEGNVHTVMLDWTTAQEVDVSHFDVEKSIEALNWNKLGSVRAQNRDVSAYQYVDEAVNRGENYYRLKMVDKDGTYDYSPIVTARFEKSAGLEVFPVPARDQITLSEEKESLDDIQIYNQIGELVLEELGSQEDLITLDVSELPTGNYFIKKGIDTVKFSKID